MIMMVVGWRVLVPLWVIVCALVWIARPDWGIATSGIVAAGLLVAVTFARMSVAWRAHTVPVGVPTGRGHSTDQERLDTDHR